MVTVLVDSNYQCHRARYTTGQFRHEGAPTGVAFGFFREVQRLYNLYGCNGRFLFAFDSGGAGVRGDVYAGYKANRYKDLTEEEKEEVKNFHRQVASIRDEYLPRLGFRNIVRHKGYEADDVIARACEEIDGPCVIVSGDKDLYQCLSNSVSMRRSSSDPIITNGTFMGEWRIPPSVWAQAKAIAGCSSDNIPGVVGVGEKTAVKWINGELRKGKKFDSIEANLDLIARNLALVCLPFPGTPSYEIKEDELDMREWNGLMRHLGISRISAPKGFV